MKNLLLILASVISINVSSQDKDCPCCTANHKAFDFWIGTWNVYNEKGDPVGKNTIEAIQGHCVIQENWESKSMTGTSFNYYDTEKDQWEQIWLDNKGGRLNLYGNLVDGKMILRSDLEKSDEGKMVFHQISWGYNTDGTVTQRWVVLNEEKEELQVIFVGIYKTSR